ncbi:MAG: hypothetical protein JW779_12050 [Candidatus Thorarchaeota archaeon]|nr:hypothetical protein [Candidatus Thorarchaeota archaeon]
MTDERMTLNEFHAKIAKETNNAIWPTLDKENPSSQELEEALHMAHTSTYHWSKVGQPINIARGEYMISRVNSAMKRGHSALAHAERSLSIAQSTEHKDWDIAFAYEAITRAYAALQDKKKYEEYKKLAQKTIDTLADEEDKNICQGELDKAGF